MPILHRHVVPNVPAWTADNGKIVFRNGAPSHRADLSLFASFGGSIGFNDDGDEPVYPPVTNFATSYTLPSKSLSSARATPFQYDAILSRQTDADDVEWLNYGNVFVDFGPEPTGEIPGPGQTGTYMEVGGYRYWWTGDVEFIEQSVCLEPRHGGRLFCRWDAGLGTSVWRIYTAGFRLSSTTVHSWDDPPYGWIGAWCGSTDDNYALRFDCADEWPLDNLFRRGHVARFHYAGPAGNNMDLSGLYIDLTAGYAA